MIIEDYEANGHGHDLDLVTILHRLRVSYHTRSECRETKKSLSKAHLPYQQTNPKWRVIHKKYGMPMIVESCKAQAAVFLNFRKLKLWKQSRPSGS